MIFLTDKSIRSNMNKFGFKTYDANVIALVNQYLQNYTKNTISRAARRNKDVDVLEASHVIQAGGRIVMPSEYFGVESGSYFSELKNNGTDMSVTNSMIRPAVVTYDLSGAIKSGGADRQFNVSQKALQGAISEAKVALQRNLRLRSDANIAMRQGFQNIMTEILQKAGKHIGSNNHHLSETVLRKIAGQRKYKTAIA